MDLDNKPKDEKVFRLTRLDKDCETNLAWLKSEHMSLKTSSSAHTETTPRTAHPWEEGERLGIVCCPQEEFKVT
ncbi:Hypothetical predicted protein [Xyrichtys novacula]|uniref:Uncharacterized protein n=1 Tax=Xyrichtys novacula TaxID=13765 RepID=A0AAV1GPP0_XYRNO|nr:Hypothetical predicted protein [Xyrichtys novacula]